jgi:LmbE family N-acetylglucosaminyl deacetylase
MCVVAHPDDECFAFGGALALAADAGVETYVVCLTDGQAASYRGDSSSAEELGRMRRAEFVRSCAVLGVSRHEVLDYQDGQLERADFSLATRRIVERIREFRPDVVLTFGADGGLNTHPDHTMVSSIASAAYHWAGWAKRFPELGVPHGTARLFHASTSFFMPERPAPTPAPWTVELDVTGVMARKHDAFCEHTSQAPLMQKTKDWFAEFGRAEHYTLMASATPGPAVLGTSLFAGL